MNAPQCTCPEPDQLRAFALGEKLDRVTAELVSQHIESCDRCGDAVASVSGDDFLARRRAAGPADGTPVPPGSLAGVARSITRPSGMPSATDDADAILSELTADPDYEIVRELGRGGMGVVYLARNRLMGRDEVLKVMGPGTTNRPGGAERFRREIQSAARLAHPNIVRAYSARQLGGSLVLAMEYVPGEDLGAVVKARGPLPVLNACYYAQQVAAGLQHAHEHGMVHRDIKPANLIVHRNGRRHTVKVLDFGLAKVTSEGPAADLTGSNQMMGTPQYMAPEQARDAATADTRADVYSLGCTLYFLLTGRPPFTGNAMELLVKHLADDPQPLHEVRPEVPEELAGVVGQMMAKDPARRFQTPGEVARALAPFVRPAAKPEPPQAGVSTAAPCSTEGDAPAASPTPPPPQGSWPELSVSEPRSAVELSAAAPSRRRPWWLWPAVAAGGLAFGLLVAAAGGVFKVKTKDGTIELVDLAPDAEVLVDGETVIVTRNGQNATVTVNRGGPHQLKVVQGGTTVYTSDLTLTIGGEPVRVRVQPTVSGPPRQIADPPIATPLMADGFVPLFNGKDLTGWSVEWGNSNQWVVENGTLVGRSKDYTTRNYLLATKEYSDFVLRFEFKAEPGANGGVALRAVENENVPVEKSMIRDHPMIKLNDPTRQPKYPFGTTHWLQDGRVDGRPTNAPPLPPGEWHPVEVTVKGQTCVAVIAGRRVVDVVLDPDTSTHRGIVPGLMRTKGKIGFQAHTGTVQFRNIEISEWVAKPAPAAAPGPNPQAAAVSDELVINGDCSAPLTSGWQIVHGQWYRKRQAVGYVFCAGNSWEGVLHQDVDAARYAADIDAGRVQFKVSGMLGSFDADRSQLKMLFLGKDKTQISVGYDTGEHAETKRWVQYGTTAAAPAGTRFVRVVLRSVTSPRKGNKENSGYYSNISLKALVSKAGTAPGGALAVPAAPPGSSVRFVGFTVHDSPEVLPQIAPYTNVVFDHSWISHGDTLVNAARERKLPVVVVFYRNARYGIEDKLLPFVRKHRDVIVGVEWSTPYPDYMPEAVDTFGQLIKKEFPGLQYWVSYTEKPPGREAGWPVSKEVDVVVVNEWYDQSPEAVRRKTNEVLPGWQKKAAGRPVVLHWVARNGGGSQATLATKPGTMKACAEVAKKYGLAGLVFGPYGRQADQFCPPINTDAAAVKEIQDIAREFGFADRR